MNKKVVIGAAAVLVVIVITAACLILLKKESIDTKQAQTIALEHAGISESEAEFTKIKSEGPVYEIEFTASDGKYEYEISSRTGEILEYSKDVVNKGKDSDVNNAPSTEENSLTVQESSQENSTITGISELPEEKNTQSANSTEEKILDIAYNHAGIKSEDVLYSEIKLDKGIYELEFDTASYEYEYDISSDGQIIKFEKEPLNGDEIGKHHEIHH